MTPDDVAEAREYANLEPHTDIARRTLALCDALTAAWAERDAMTEADRRSFLRAERAESELRDATLAAQQLDGIAAKNEMWAIEQRNRAERAEAEHEYTQKLLTAVNQQTVAHAAALARVRDLCGGRPAHDYLEVARILSAIEGP